jgi:hypothetical protein
MRQSGTGGREQTLDVDGNHAVPLVDVGTDHGAQEHQAGVVDERVQPSESLDGLVDSALGLGAVGDVRSDDERRAACRFDVGGKSFQSILAASDERDGGTALGE